MTDKEKKYELIESDIKGLFRVKAIRDFGDVSVGDIGGYVESEDNLSQFGCCWVRGDARVFGDARVYGNAQVCGNAWVYGNVHVYDNALVYGDARVYSNAQVYGDVRVYGNAQVYGNAKVCDNADYIVFKNWWSSGRFFTWTRSNNMWKVGYFYGTGKELIEKSYADSELSGREYERVVRYVESILKEAEK